MPAKAISVLNVASKLVPCTNCILVFLQLKCYNLQSANYYTRCYNPLSEGWFATNFKRGHIIVTRRRHNQSSGLARSAITLLASIAAFSHRFQLSKF